MIKPNQLVVKPNKLVYVLGMSGGKDSTALALWVKHESGLPLDSVRCVFTDTKNESELTYDHINKISREILPVEWISSDLGFFELAEHKKRFPSAKARFCTQFLKIFPIRDYIKSLLDDGFDVVSLSGERAGESIERAKKPEREIDLTFGCHVWRPILSWTIDDVYAIHNKYNFPLNPLYSLGARRVGCFPCIMSRKKEIRILSENFPERIDELRKWEIKISSTFYPRKMTPAQFRSKKWTNKKGKVFFVPTIDDVVLWSKTGHGGKNFEFKGFSRDEMESVIACDVGGLCE